MLAGNGGNGGGGLAAARHLLNRGAEVRVEHPRLAGELWLADISIPPAAYERIGVHVPEVCAADTVVQLDTAEVE